MLNSIYGYPVYDYQMPMVQQSFAAGVQTPSLFQYQNQGVNAVPNKVQSSMQYVPSKNSDGWAIAAVAGTVIAGIAALCLTRGKKGGNRVPTPKGGAPVPHSVPTPGAPAPRPAAPHTLPTVPPPAPAPAAPAAHAPTPTPTPAPVVTPPPASVPTRPTAPVAATPSKPAVKTPVTASPAVAAERKTASFEPIMPPITPEKLDEFAKYTPKDLQPELSRLKAHNFANDKSTMGVYYANQGNDTVSVDSTGVVKWFEKHLKLYTVGKGQRTFSIKTLPDGRKVVGMEIFPGNHGTFRDFAGRDNIKYLEVISDGTEFTPLQKALIDIISASRTISPEQRNKPLCDLIALGMHKSCKSSLGSGKPAMDRDILNSAIVATRQELASKIDQDFVSRALNLKPSEVLEFLNR